MTQQKLHELLLQHLSELNLTQIAAICRETLDEAARRNCSMLEVLVTLTGAEVTARRERASSAAPHQAGQAAETEDPGGIQIRIPQTHTQTAGAAAVRL